MTDAEAAPPTDRRRSRYRLPVAGTLAGAFVLAAGITAGLTGADLLPSGLSGHAPLLWAFHLLGFGTAALALVDRAWAWWIVAVLTAGYVVVGLQLYAVLFLPGLMTTVVWFANDLHIGLLVVAECLCVRGLVGTEPC
jgi:hypothetical protein